MKHPLPRTVSLVILLSSLTVAAALRAGDRSGGQRRFLDAGSQAAEYIGYSSSIRLTPAQQKLRDAVLEKIPAPCCSKFSSRTCCCPCNLAKSIWGLSNLVVARENGGAPEVEKAVRVWIRFINARGYAGNTCDTAGGCGRKFSESGCGGMNEKVLDAAR